MDRPRIRLVARLDPRGLNGSHIALNENTVSPQESQGLEESATCLFEISVEGVLKETHDTRITIHHRILIIVIHMLKVHLSVDIQMSLEKPAELKIGTPIPRILPVVMASRYRQLLDQGHEEGLGERDTQILNQLQKMIIT